MSGALLPRDAWPAAVASLVAVRAREEHLSTGLVNHIAELCGKSPRTLWRWVERGGVPDYERPSHTLTDEELANYARSHGKVTAVHRELYDGHPDAPSVRTLQRAFKKLSPTEKAMACRGVAARRAEELNVMQSHSHTRRNELWPGDHSQLNWVRLV